MEVLSINYIKLSDLANKMNDHTASRADEDEFMYLMHAYGKISTKIYENYKANKFRDDILNGVLAVGAAVLLGYVLKEILD